MGFYKEADKNFEIYKHNVRVQYCCGFPDSQVLFIIVADR